MTKLSMKARKKEDGDKTSCRSEDQLRPSESNKDKQDKKPQLKEIKRFLSQRQ